MTQQNHCLQCKAPQTDNTSCQDHFYTLGFWELDYQLFDMHHLMVLCFYLQHPSTVSQEWLCISKKLLIDFVEHEVKPRMVRNNLKAQVDSGSRKFNIGATHNSQAQYNHPVEWSMTIQGVVNQGRDNYYSSVQQWAESILQCLRESKNLL